MANADQGIKENTPLLGPIAQLFSGTSSVASEGAFIDMLEATGDYASPEIAVGFLAFSLESQSPVQLFESYDGKTFKVENLVLNSWLSVHHIEKQVRGPAEEARTVAGYIAAYRYRDTWLLTATRRDMEMAKTFSDYLAHCLVSWSEVFYPELTRTVIRSRELVNFLARLNESDDVSVEVIRSTMKYPHGGYQRTERIEELGVVTERLEDEGGYLNRATIRLTGKSSYVATIGRDGLFYRHSGELRPLLLDISQLLHRSTAEKQTLEEVFRSSSPECVGALDVDFGMSIGLGSLESSEILVGALEADPSLSVTVLHGNPYLHISITDLANGSTFSLYSNGPSGLRIYPGLHADRTGMQHLLNCISQNFADINTFKGESFLMPLGGGK